MKDILAYDVKATGCSNSAATYLLHIIIYMYILTAYPSAAHQAKYADVHRSERGLGTT